MRGRRQSTLIAFIVSMMMAPVASAQTLTAVWDPSPSEDEILGYEVCISTSYLTCNIQQARVPATEISYAFAPDPGVAYGVAVRAVSADGPGWYSPEVTVSIPRLGQLANQINAANTPISPVVLSASDPDGGALRYSHSGLPIGLTLNPITGVITGTPASIGTTNVTVFVSDGLATTSRSFTWTIASSPSAVTLSSNLASPRPVGTSITFTAAASGGTPPYQFKWWVYNGSTWTMVRDWSSSTYTWTPSVANGNYRVGVWARDSSTNADLSNVNLSVPYAIGATAPIQIASLTSNLASPRAINTPITFTAVGSGGTGSYQFKWWVFDGATWTMARDWGSATYTWTPTVASSNYRVGIWARDATTTADVSSVNMSVPYVVTGGTALPAPPAPSAPSGRLTLTGITSSVPGAIQGGTTVTFTASATGGRAPYQFKWWVYDRGEWSRLADWGAATVTVTLWRGSLIGVWVRDSTSTADVGDVNMSVPFTIFY